VFKRHLAVLILTAVLASLSISIINGQQGGTTIYVYDDDGRLIAVVSPTGEASTYEYDAAGNFTRIRRFTPNDLEMLAFTPHQGPVGTPVTIYGTGFNQGVNTVSFNGVVAIITSSNFASVVAIVPVGATTGPITVVTPRGTVTSTTPFVVRGIRLTPQSITLPALETVQFNLSISGTPTNNVVWSVDGAQGGNTNVGTITTSGFYVAPNLVGGNVVQFTVRATSVDDPELFGEALVTVVPFGAGFQFRSDGLSVRYGTPPNTPPTYINGAVSVRYGTPPNTPPTYINGAVSVRYGTPANTPPTYINGAVSVQYGTPANTPATFINGAVSASRGPVLQSLTPGTIARGATTTLTVTGVALNGATSVRLFRLSNGSPENNVTVSNINVNSQGTSLTANLTVASSVATGGYLVVLTTPAGSTVRNDTGNNTVQIN
jgi:YD repeat-containing protein